MKDQGVQFTRPSRDLASRPACFVIRVPVQLFGTTSALVVQQLHLDARIAGAHVMSTL